MKLASPSVASLVFRVEVCLYWAVILNQVLNSIASLSIPTAQISIDTEVVLSYWEML